MKKTMLAGFYGALLYSNTAAQVSLNYGSQPGHTYQIQFNPALDRFWRDAFIATNVGSVSLSLPTTGASGFYRVLDENGPVFWYGWTQISQSPTLRDWGMGVIEISYVHNDRPYDWYIDQADTGPDADVNCGPSSAAMACKWQNQATMATPEDARKTYPEGDGWWYTYDVRNYLQTQGVSCDYCNANISTLTNILGQGNIAILCLNMEYIPYNPEYLERVQSFYWGATGHFIVVKGYRRTNMELWFECYDPGDLGAVYTDGTPKGRDRHYGWYELNNAIMNWWPYFIVVYPNASAQLHASNVSRLTEVRAACGQ